MGKSKLEDFVSVLIVAFMVAVFTSWIIVGAGLETIDPIMKSGIVSAITVSVGSVVAKWS